MQTPVWIPWAYEQTRQPQSKYLCWGLGRWLPGVGLGFGEPSELAEESSHDL